MSLPPYATIASEFALDGSLRDIYVPGATLVDWQTVLDVLGHHWGPITVTDRSGTTVGSRLDATDLVARAELSPIILGFRCGPIAMTLYFWGGDAAEFSFAPNDVADQPALDIVTGFMQQVGTATGKRVRLTPENSEDFMIIEFDPMDGGRWYHRPPDNAAL